MKVLLIAPEVNQESISIASFACPEPLALEYIGAGVKENHDVKLVDLRAPSEPSLPEVLESFQPDIIGCGALTTEVNPVKEVFAEAKKKLPHVLTVVGGAHATVVPEDFFDKSVDVVVTGEGVFPFKKICDNHEKGKNFDDVENIYARKNGKMVFTKKKEYPPLDSLPFPDRTLTSHVRYHYSNPIRLGNAGVATIRSSAGCYYRCKFCAVPEFLGGKLYRRSVEKVVEELGALDASFIFWLDDEFLLDPDRVIRLAREIGKAGIKKNHYICSRADALIKHPECIDEWVKIGLEFVFVGLEGAREQDLKKLEKRSSLSNNEESVRILHDRGVKIRSGFIVHQDFEKKDFKEFGKYIRNSGVDVPSFSVLTPVPGTKYHREVKDNLITANYNLYDMLHTVLPTKLPLKQFYEELHDLVMKKGMKFRTKLKLWKDLDPKLKKKIIPFRKELSKKLKNAYMHYDKALW